MPILAAVATKSATSEISWDGTSKILKFSSFYIAWMSFSNHLLYRSPIKEQFSKISLSEEEIFHKRSLLLHIFKKVLEKGMFFAFSMVPIKGRDFSSESIIIWRGVWGIINEWGVYNVSYNVGFQLELVAHWPELHLLPLRCFFSAFSLKITILLLNWCSLFSLNYYLMLDLFFKWHFNLLFIICIISFIIIFSWCWAWSLLLLDSVRFVRLHSGIRWT